MEYETEKQFLGIKKEISFLFQEKQRKHHCMFLVPVSDGLMHRHLPHLPIIEREPTPHHTQFLKFYSLASSYIVVFNKDPSCIYVPHSLLAYIAPQNDDLNKVPRLHVY